MKFLVLIIIFVFTFGVTARALLFPNQNLEISLLGRIFLPAYFVITGSYDLKDKVYAAINTSLSGRIIEFIIIYHFL